MSLDNDIKDAFQRHEQDAHANDTAWAGIESKIRRAHHQRMAFASALSVAVIAAVAVLVPKLGSSHQDKGNFTNPSRTPTATSPEPTVTPTPQAAAPIPSGWQRRVGIQSGFQIAMPADWKGGWFEGTWDFEPKSLPSDAQGGDTFVVLVTLEHGSYDASPGRGAKATEINGHRALVWQPRTTETDYRLEWNFCDGYAPTCSSNFETQTLRVTIRGSTSPLWSQYESTGRQIVETVDTYDGATPVHGTVAASIQEDDFSRALVRFLDARVEGIGADELLSQTAGNFYANRGGLYDLDTADAQSYEITAGPTGARQHEFGITMSYAGGATRQELITLSRDNPQAVPVIANVCTGVTSC
jgi:hypothetical protein